MSEQTKEIEAINQLIADLYSSICFEKGQTPPLDTLRRVFMLGGKMMNNDGDAPLVWTVDEYIERFKGIIANGKFQSFHEVEIAHTTELFGKIAHRFSTYETRLSLEDEKPYSVGINSIQLIKIGSDWRITCMTWNNQTDECRIPAKYL